MDTETSKISGMDIAMSRHGYSDASFLLHRILHQKVRNVEKLHGKIHAFVLVNLQWKQLNFIQEFILFITHKTSSIYHFHDKLSIKYIADIKHTRILILRKSCPATSYVDATFHPTIGQRAHQSLSTTATPKLGMIPTRYKGTITDSHTARPYIHSQANTQLGFTDC